MAAKKKVADADTAPVKEVAVIREAKTDTLRHNGEQFLDVIVDIKEGDEVVDTLRLGFKADANAEDIKAEIAKLLQTRTDEAARKDTQTAQDALDAAATETISALEGITIE